MPSTDLEQFFLELVNNARLDPTGVAARFITSYSPLTSSDADIQAAFNKFSVSGTALQTALQALTPVKPVAWNENLATASRGHNNAMIAADQQSLQLPGEPDLATRTNNAGYTGWTDLNQSIYASAASTIHGFAAFMVDWGPGTADGMQNPPQGRNTIMNPVFREIGIGLTPESNPATQVGPLVVTEEYGTRPNSGSFLLGVAYNDADANHFYSSGEGLGTLNVSLGATNVTSFASGGYTLQTAATGSQTVTLTGGGLTGAVSVAVNLAANSNVKLDVIDGNTLNTSTSAVVSGPISKIVGLGTVGLSLQAVGATAHTIVGAKGNDTLTGDTGQDSLFGGAGNDVLIAGAGNDSIDGEGGIDTAAFSGARNLYSISRSDGHVVVSGPDGTDTLSGTVELLQFNDTTVSIRVPHSDFNADASSDILWQNDSGQAAIWLMDGTRVLNTTVLGFNPGSAWHVKGSGDFDGDGQSDILWQNDNGQASIWIMNGTAAANMALAGSFNPGPTWHIKGAGDFDGDGKSDILWQDDSGQAAIWLMNGTSFVRGQAVGGFNPGPTWHIKGAGDFDGDGKSDILWQSDSGQAAIWIMDGTTLCAVRQWVASIQVPLGTSKGLASSTGTASPTFYGRTTAAWLRFG